MSDTILLPEIKRGQTFLLTINVNDTSVQLSELKSQIRDGKNNLIAELQIEAEPAPSTFTLSAINTTSWPLGSLFMDIRRTTPEQIYYSKTLVVPVIKGVTE